MDNWRKAAHSNPNGACVEIGSEWRKASFSQGASNCAEVAAWRKSEYSESSNCAEIGGYRTPSESHANGNCAEVGSGAQVVAVRDTKEAALGEARTVLEFTPGAWNRFLAEIR